MTKDARIYNGEKRISSTRDVEGKGKEGQLHVKQLKHKLEIV